MLTMKGLGVAFGGCIVASCSTPQQVAKPSDVTVRSAVIELADTFNELQQRVQGRPKVGLLVDEATVEFNVAAKATNKANASATADALPFAQGTLGLSVANEAYAEGSRGNKITITFKNVATADYSKGGKEIADKCLRAPVPPGCPPILMSPM